MATFTVVIPLKGVDKTHNNKGELVGIPFLGPCTRELMNDAQLINFVAAFMNGGTASSMCYIEKHPDA